MRCDQEAHEELELGGGALEVQLARGDTLEEEAERRGRPAMGVGELVQLAPGTALPAAPSIRLPSIRIKKTTGPEDTVTLHLTGA